MSLLFQMGDIRPSLGFEDKYVHMDTRGSR